MGTSRPAIAAAFVLAALCSAGCLRTVVETETRGTLPTGAVLSRIKLDETTREALVEVLGEPQYVESLSGGRDLLIYDYQEFQTTTRSLPLLYYHSCHSGQPTRVVRTCFEIAGGVVVRGWQDRPP